MAATASPRLRRGGSSEGKNLAILLSVYNYFFFIDTLTSRRLSLSSDMELVIASIGKIVMHRQVNAKIPKCNMDMTQPRSRNFGVGECPINNVRLDCMCVTSDCF